MKVDLYKSIYKMISQRVRRAPRDACAKEMKDLIKFLLTRKNLSKQEMLEIEDEIDELEKISFSGKVRYALRLRRAIEEDDYYIRIPYEISHLWNEGEYSYGWVYIAISKHKPGLLKLGATGIDPFRRCRQIERKYGTPMELRWKKFTLKPFKLEKLTQEAISSCRVSALTEGESNEWFETDLKHLNSVIEPLHERLNSEK